MIVKYSKLTNIIHLLQSIIFSTNTIISMLIDIILNIFSNLVVILIILFDIFMKFITFMSVINVINFMTFTNIMKSITFTKFIIFLDLMNGQNQYLWPFGKKHESVIF